MKCRICGYIAESRSQMEEHHIRPRSLGGSEDEWNKAMICSRCHSKTFVDGAHGKHGVKAHNSIVIMGWVQSSAGRLLHIIDELGEKFV